MTVIVLEKVSKSLSGYLSRWLIEVHTGTFVGHLAQRVRQNLWEEVCGSLTTGSAFMVYATNDEQGYRCDFWGYPSRRIRDFDGLQLIEIYDLPASLNKKLKRLRKKPPVYETNHDEKVADVERLDTSG